MPMRNARSNRSDDLLDCRMAMLGLDIAVTRSSNPDTFETIRRMCSSCAFRDACAVDLERDPNNPVWETYCPSAGALIALSEERFRGDLAAH